MAASGTEWIKLYGEYLESLLDPSVKSRVKQEYIQWVKARENYYATLKDVAPEFLELLEVIEKNLHVRVEIKDEGKDETKSPSKELEPKIKDKE